MISRIVKYFIKNDKTMLGRWSLKHNCPTEALTVFNANRDHCGDTICGKPIKHENSVSEPKGKYQNP